VQVLQVMPVLQVRQVPGLAAEPGQLFARMTRVREVPTG
jgi:hypothetical protein